MEVKCENVTPDDVEQLMGQVREIGKEAEETESRQKLENEEFRREVAQMKKEQKQLILEKIQKQVS